MNALYAQAKIKTDLQMIIEMQKAALACGGCAVGIGGPNQFRLLIQLIEEQERTSGISNDLSKSN